MTNEAQFTAQYTAQYTAHHAQQDGKDALIEARNALLAAANQLDSYIHQYESATHDHEPDLHERCKYQARVVGYAINYTASSVINNVRIDRLADAQAALTVAAQINI